MHQHLKYYGSWQWLLMCRCWGHLAPSAPQVLLPGCLTGDAWVPPACDGQRSQLGALLLRLLDCSHSQPPHQCQQEAHWAVLA
jgi:hypothetical protein